MVFSSAARARVAIALFGIALPYLARLPGVASRGPSWLAQITAGNAGAFLFTAAFEAVLWISVVAATLPYRHLRSYWFPVILGFAWPAFQYARLDLASSSTAALALIFIPLEGLPFLLAGFLTGWWWDRRQRSASAVQTAR